MISYEMKKRAAERLAEWCVEQAESGLDILMVLDPEMDFDDPGLELCEKVVARAAEEIFKPLAIRNGAWGVVDLMAQSLLLAEEANGELQKYC